MTEVSSRFYGGEYGDPWQCVSERSTPLRLIVTTISLNTLWSFLPPRTRDADLEPVITLVSAYLRRTGIAAVPSTQSAGRIIVAQEWQLNHGHRCYHWETLREEERNKWTWWTEIKRIISLIIEQFSHNTNMISWKTKEREIKRNCAYAHDLQEALYEWGIPTSSFFNFFKTILLIKFLINGILISTHWP